jgi:hypothetical protein
VGPQIGGEGKDRNGLSIGMRRPFPGELLGLAILTKALALERLPVARRMLPTGLMLGLGRDALGLSHLTLIGTVVRTTV